MKILLSSLFLFLASGTQAQTSSSESSCPTIDVSIGGSSDLFPLVQKWVDGYKTECSNTNLILEQPCSSTCGARRVCLDDSSTETPLDVGTISRPWRDLEATSENGFVYQCAASDRELISVNVAIDGLAFAVGTGGVAHDCITILGGLTVDQLRWIYSDLTRQELIDSGWDPTSLENDDMDDSTHLWSELDADCAATEIHISGGTYDSADYQFVVAELFKTEEEDIPIDTPRTTGSDTYLEYYQNDSAGQLASHVKNSPAAITFLKYAWAEDYEDIMTIVPIKNKYGAMVVPDPYNIMALDYTPFARKMHMNIVNDANILQAMKGFLEYAYSAKGKQMVEEAGYFGISEWEEKIILSVVDADTQVWGDFDCGSNPVPFEIAGSLSAYAVARVWADVYRAKCGVNVKVVGGGSTRGGERVCGTSHLENVAIGTMSRNFKPSEAVTRNGYMYDCVGTGLKVIQLEAAIEALAVAVKAGGVAEKCIDRLGGLTLPQLRWIYSSMTENELRHQGWSFHTIPNSDGDPTTHLWSELLDHPDCPDIEIKISGASDDSLFLDFFEEYVLPNYEDGEDFATNRPSGFYQSGDEGDLVKYLVDNDDAISFMSYSYYAANDESIWAVKILNEFNVYVEPVQVSIEDGSYTPFSRRVYLNVLDTPENLEITRAFLELGLSDMGTQLVRYTGNTPLPESDRMVMRARAQTSSGYAVSTSIECGPPGEVIKMAGSTTAYPISTLWGDIYEIGCDVAVEIEGGGSSLGAGRICGGRGSPIDIGLMSREWNTNEGTKNGAIVTCTDWDTSRSAIQIPIALYGIALATANNGYAKSCIDSLGGLTRDQLRWIFSSYDQNQLVATGWNPSSLPNSDFDESTHLWSELSNECESTEILIAGASDLRDIYYDFVEAILTDYGNGETIAANRPTGYVSGASYETIASYVMENDAAVGFFAIDSMNRNPDSLSVIAVENSAGSLVIPSDSSIQSGLYDILSKRIFMNLNNEAESLISTVPFVRFGLSEDGISLVQEAGYVPLPDQERQQILSMLCRSVGACGGVGSSITSIISSTATSTTGTNTGMEPGGIVGVVFLVVAVIAVVSLVVIRRASMGKEADSGDPNLSPYAGSRTNWASQEAEVEAQNRAAPRTNWAQPEPESIESIMQDIDFQSANRAVV